MSALINQITIVTVLVISTILVANCVECDELSVRSQLRIKCFDEKEGKESRSRTYLRLDLSESEESSRSRVELVSSEKQ